MDKIAFVFSGQGDQYPGMGKEIYEKYPVAAEIYSMCDTIRPGTTFQCFNGTESDLSETKNTQPCLFVTELAAANVLMKNGILPNAVAGFSLGEVVAATVSGLFDNDIGFQLVCKRGELMQIEAEKFDTSMAAVVKLSADEVKRICEKYSDIYLVNFNCPGQISISGLSSQMSDFFADVKNAGGKAIPLKVKGAFHSPFMSKAADSFAKELSRVNIKNKNIMIYSNMTAMPYNDDVVRLLSQQICNPVRWEEIIRNMIDDGINIFIEIGPGKTLTNMIKKINPEVKALGVTDYLSEVENVK